MPDDFTGDISTSAVLTLGSYSSGTLETEGDRDWFAVTLTAGTTYRVDIEGGYGSGELGNPSLIGIYDSSGSYVSNTAREGGGVSEFGWGNLDARGFFTPDSSGIYYISAGSKDTYHDTGDYTVRVTDNWDDYASNTSTTGALATSLYSDIYSASGQSDWAGDVDWFAVELEAGQTYRVVVNGRWDWSSRSTGDGYLKGVYDSSGVYISGTRDDNGGAGNGALSLFTAPTSGTYYVAAGLSPSSDGKGGYQIALSGYDDDYTQDATTTGAVTVDGTVRGRINRADDRDWIAVDLVAGEDYTVVMTTQEGYLHLPYIHSIRTADGVRMDGVSDRTGWGDEDAVVSFQATTTGTHYVDIGGYVWSNRTGAYTVKVVSDEVADDDSTTARVAVDGAIHGNIDFQGDRDWIAVDLVAGGLYNVTMRGFDSKGGTLPDPYLYSIRDASGSHITGSSDNNSGRGGDAQTLFIASATGTYYIDARAAARTETTGSYRVDVTQIFDDFASDTSTTGVLALGVDTLGKIDAPTEIDWFAATLTAGTEYRIDVLGESTGDGGLDRPWLAGLYDAAGAVIPGSAAVGGGSGYNTSTVFTVAADGTYYVAAGGGSNTTGSYTLRLTERVELTGTSGDDWLNPNDLAGAELSGITGGSGVDMASFAGAAGPVHVDLHADQAVLGGDILALGSIENVTGTSFDDVFVGSDRSEIFRGLGGQDIFYGSDHGDSYDGGAGQDLLSYAQSSAGVSVSLLQGRGWEGDAQGDLIRNVENLTGSMHDDFIWGDHGNNRLEGGYGNDVITGNDGDDYILAGFGTDTIVFSGNQSEYTITRDGIATTVDHTGGNGKDGTDLIGHAEILRFADGDLIL